jgi:secreted Zn-dependent insulinase-like peptidase
MIWKNVLDMHLREFRYVAAMVDLNLSVQVQPTSVIIKWSGFSDSLGTFLTQSIEKIKEMPARQDLFDIQKSVLYDSLRNSLYDPTHVQATSQYKILMSNKEIEKNLLWE